MVIFFFDHLWTFSSSYVFFPSLCHSSLELPAFPRLLVTCPSSFFFFFFSKLSRPKNDSHNAWNFWHCKARTVFLLATWSSIGWSQGLLGFFRISLMCVDARWHVICFFFASCAYRVSGLSVCVFLFNAGPLLGHLAWSAGEQNYAFWSEQVLWLW